VAIEELSSARPPTLGLRLETLAHLERTRRLAAARPRDSLLRVKGYLRWLPDSRYRIVSRWLLTATEFEKDLPRATMPSESRNSSM
jgi:hypothetical protein